MPARRPRLIRQWRYLPRRCLRFALSVDVLSSDYLLLRHFLRRRYSEPGKRRRAAVNFGAERPCEKQCGACRDASEHCDDPVGRALVCVLEFMAARLLPLR